METYKTTDEKEFAETQRAVNARANIRTITDTLRRILNQTDDLELARKACDMILAKLNPATRTEIVVYSLLFIASQDEHREQEAILNN